LSQLGMRIVKERKQRGSQPSQQLVQVRMEKSALSAAHTGEFCPNWAGAVKERKQRGSKPSQQLVQVRMEKSALSAAHTGEFCPYWACA
jgi:hypothetical protein